MFSFSTPMAAASLVLDTTAAPAAEPITTELVLSARNLLEAPVSSRAAIYFAHSDDLRTSVRFTPLANPDECARASVLNASPCGPPCLAIGRSPALCFANHLRALVTPVRTHSILTGCPLHAPVPALSRPFQQLPDHSHRPLR